MPPRVLACACVLWALAVLPASASAAAKKVAFRFSATSYSVVEKAGTFNVTVVRSGNTAAAASVQYSDNGTGTATGGGVNYSFTGGTLTFAPGETRKSFPVAVVDNATANAPNKTIVLRLANATPAGAQIKTTTAKLTIIDDEGPGTLDFSASSFNAVEGSGVATITVNRIGASNLRVSVDYATQTASSSPATAGADYTSISPARTLTFAPGEVSRTFQVAITDDTDAEGPEDVGLLLSNPQNLTAGAAPQIGPNGPARLTIADDDVSTFSFSSPAYSVAEDDPTGHATITVKRAGATNLPASVGYATSDGTATAGSDYTAAAGTVGFAAGETTKTFLVDVSNDGAAEANETVGLALKSGATTIGSSLLSIVDNDNAKASVQLSSPVYSAGEGADTVGVTVTLSHPVDADVTIDYATADGTASAGADYTDTHGTLTFKGNLANGGPGTGETSKTIQVPIGQDADAEDPETLTVALSNALPGASSILGAPASATVTIADDDPPGSIDFTSLRYDVDEAAGQATVTVERVGGVGGAVSVDYRTLDGTATAGSDYTAAAGTLTWAAGDSADKTFTVPIRWDGRAEATEAISLELTDPGGGADLGPNGVAVVRVGDDGASGPLRLSATSYRAGESGGAVTITAKRSGGSLGGPVTVDYATADGTALAGSDYATAHGTLSFAPGEASKSFTVPVIGDRAHEPGETFKVLLSNAGGGASLGSPAGAVVTITDDDAAPPPSAPPASRPSADTTAPRLALAGRKVQRALRTKLLKLSARCSERCRLAVVARVRLGGKRVVLRRVKATALPGGSATLRIRLSKSRRSKLRRAMRHGKAQVVLTVSATDGAGNRATASRRVTVKR